MNKITKRMTYLTTATLLMSTLSGITSPILATDLLTDPTEFSFSTIDLLKSTEFPETRTSSSALTYNFEDNTQGWISRGTGIPTLCTTTSHSGDSCIYVSNRTDNWHGVAQDFTGTLQKEKTYTFSAWVKYDEGADTESIKLTLENGGTTSPYITIGSVTAEKDQWTHLTGKVTIPEDMVKANVYFEAPTETLAFYVDDITITGDFTTDEDSSNNVNWSFESSLDDWTNRGNNTTVSSSSTNPHTGNNCLSITGRTATWNGAQKDITTLISKGDKHTFGAWVRYDEGADTESITLTLQVSTASQDTASYNPIKNISTVKKGEWTYLEGDYVLPSDTTEAILYVEAEKTLIDFYIDDISMSYTATATPPPNIEIQKDIPSLKDVYKDYFKFGTAISPRYLNDLEKELVTKHFNSITCENAMKPDAMLDYNATIKYMEENNGDETHPQVRLSADAIATLDYARDNNISIRGHVLVWHSQTPNWFFTENYSTGKDAKFVSKEVMLQRLENYIDAVFKLLSESYPDVDFYAFDVVNEAVNPSVPGGLRPPATSATTSGDDGNNENANNSMWMTTIGAEHIEKAFEYARDASDKYFNGKVKLAYNDYNECDADKVEIIYRICKDLYDKGLIDVIGMQAHYNMSTPSITQFENAVRKYASIGENIELQITELDLGQPDDSEEGLLKQAYRYQDFLDTMKRLENEGVADFSSCVVWGVLDSESWRSDGSPLLFDANYQAKPAFWGIADASKLPVPTQEINAYSVTNNNIEEALLIQNGTTLHTVNGTELGKFKVAWDTNNLYIKVLPSETASGKSGTIKVFLEDQTLSTSLSQNTITLPLSHAISSGNSLRFEISMDVEGQIASWNNPAFDGNLAPTTANLGKVLFVNAPKVAAAPKATPIIDGTIDTIWNKATTLNVDTFSVGNNGATAIAKTLWDDNYVYVLMQVKDSLLSKESANSYEQDSVEIFIDEDNAKSTSYELGDIQYRVNFANERSINGDSDANSFKTATTPTADGYILEAAFPARLAKFKEGQVIGFDLQINDDANGNGTRDNVSNWNDLTGMGWSSTAGYGVLKLAAPVTPPSSSDDDVPGSNTNTGGGSGGGSVSNTTLTQSPVELITQALTKNELPTLTLDTTNKATLSSDALNLLTQKTQSLAIQTNGISTILTPVFITTNLANTTSLDVSIVPMSSTTFTTLKNQLNKTPDLTLVGDASQIFTLDLKTAQTLTQFTEPLALTLELSKVNVPSASGLTLVRYTQNTDGSFTLTKLGGSYNQATHTFSALVDQPGTYGVIKADSLTKINLQLNRASVSLNEQQSTMDVAPEVVDGRTLVPLRFICEALDLKVDWDNKTKEITLISSDEQTLTLGINKNIQDYGAPIITNGRTLVPLRYISEELGANVLWVPSTKAIEIVK